MSLGEWLLAFAKLVLLMVFNVRLCRVFQPLAPLSPPCADRIRTACAAPMMPHYAIPTCTVCTHAPQQLVLLPFVALVPALAGYFDRLDGRSNESSQIRFFKNGYLLQTGFFQAEAHALHTSTHTVCTHHVRTPYWDIPGDRLCWVRARTHDLPHGALHHSEYDQPKRRRPLPSKRRPRSYEFSCILADMDGGGTLVRADQPSPSPFNPLPLLCLAFSLAHGLASSSLGTSYNSCG